MDNGFDRRKRAKWSYWQVVGIAVIDSRPFLEIIKAIEVM